MTLAVLVMCRPAPQYPPLLVQSDTLGGDKSRTSITPKTTYAHNEPRTGASSVPVAGGRMRGRWAWRSRPRRDARTVLDKGVGDTADRTSTRRPCSGQELALDRKNSFGDRELTLGSWAQTRSSAFDSREELHSSSVPGAGPARDYVL